MQRPLPTGHAAEVVFQVTLSGAGRYAAGGREWQVGKGMAFTAYIPSAHVYWLPEDAPGPWTFFWMIIEHPYVVERLRQLNERRGEVIELTASELQASSRLFQQTCSAQLDDISQEQALLDWWLTLERASSERRAGPGARLLAEATEYTRANIHRSFGVEELASLRGMSRTHYTHLFRKVTGRTPAAVVLSVRLAKVAQSLAESHLTLPQIAQHTGFANANHLSKVFKRCHGLTPGQFRRSRGTR